jgi:GTP cyclohydrolase I
LVDEVADKFQGVLRSLIIDTSNDHNTQDTARRVAKMFVRETFSGRYANPPKVTAFPNVTEYDQLYVTGPITIRSTCAHHFQNIVGRAYIGVFPGRNVIGLSKFNRITDWIASRPQIQEEMTVQIADAIERETEADGVAVLIQAEHHCMTHRGVKEHESDMTTSVMRGKFRDDHALKQEFFSIVGKMK